MLSMILWMPPSQWLASHCCTARWVTSRSASMAVAGLSASTRSRRRATYQAGPPGCSPWRLARSVSFGAKL
ncbi:unnamed protein product [Symbiodinium natans]|uniref:Secreted protein n=1 Tax=Symbiodinium natans TaxID=878477 RepID=A0A812SNM4_9DINO|nr:unnamed protein product [Symbiodinium natans]